MAAEAQEDHRETSGKEGLIQDFLDKEIPENWDSLKLSDRRMHLNGNLKLPEGTALIKRDKTCAVEIYVECLGGDPRYMNRRDSMEINGILSGMREWEKVKTPRKFGIYGSQKGFRRRTTLGGYYGD